MFIDSKFAIFPVDFGAQQYFIHTQDFTTIRFKHLSRTFARTFGAFLRLWAAIFVPDLIAKDLTSWTRFRATDQTRETVSVQYCWHAPLVNDATICVFHWANAAILALIIRHRTLGRATISHDFWNTLISKSAALVENKIKVTVINHFPNGISAPITAKSTGLFYYFAF